ncbi:MAG TPA: Uma2 family endonuclease [Urbifossiella sp.]|nr:Uma2 family endonuclease [Urbifossiella sp.]
MTPTATPPPTRSNKSPRDRVFLMGVSWDDFRRMRHAMRFNRSVRFAFDRGELEIMTIGLEHDKDSNFLGHLIEVLTEELGLPLVRGGSVTIGRKRLKRAIEPDKCYWIGNATAIAGVKRLDLRIHPPPDLAVEVDVTHSSLDRFGVYAKLGVVELWRLDGDDLRVRVRSATGRYDEVPTTPTFPGLDPAELIPFLREARETAYQNEVTRRFREWVRVRFGREAGPVNEPAAGGEPAAG